MASEHHLESEVCVIGGGPAGAVTALRLVQLGHSVCLVERQPFPRPHIGESLPPSILPLLDLLSLRDRVEAAGFLRPRHAIVRWMEEAAIDKPFDAEPGFQVDRGHFDALLLSAAAGVGVRIIQPATARRPFKDASGWWRIPVASHEGKYNIRARCLVDAVGKRSLSSGGSSTQSPPTIALSGYWRSHKIAGPAARIEAGRNQWYWGAPLPDGSFNATVFIDPKSCSARSKSDLERAYRVLINQSNLLRPCLAGRLSTPIQACDATSRCALEPVGPDWIKVGESAYSIDPLSSQGVQTAMRTALQAAIVIHTIRTTPQNTIAAMEFCRDQQREAVARHQRIAAQLYAQRADLDSTPFWTQRALSTEEVQVLEPMGETPLPAFSSVVRLADDARLEPTPVIDGEHIVCKLALVFPTLQRRVAFLHGHAIDDLLAMLQQPRTVSELFQLWSRFLPMQRAVDVLRWLWSFQIITLVDDSIHQLSSAFHQTRSRRS